ncbi:hypothetical protein PG984_003088 [Apiospora sp. TS-2023a]
MMLWILVAALWAQLGTTLPLASFVNDPAVFDGVETPTSNSLSNITRSSALESRDSTISTRGRIVKRVTWPWDVPGEDGNLPDWQIEYDPGRYNCNRFAGLHNRIPPYLKAGVPPTEDRPQNPWYGNEIYSDVEIYTAFRRGGDDYDANHDVPGFVRTTCGYRAYLTRIGLGNWNPTNEQQNRPLNQRTTLIHEYPLVAGGNYPYAGNVMANNPGWDRVLFQLVNGLPLYLGVVAQRRNIPRNHAQTEADLRDQWAYPVYDANHRPDTRAVDSMFYPGLVSDNPALPNMEAMKKRRQRKSVTPVAPKNYTPLPMSSGDPGGGAGAPGGNSAGPVGPGGFSKSGGGTAGPQGGLGERYVAPMPGNQFKAGWNLFIPGPSHVEL